jgi:hypothetical protein
MAVAYTAPKSSPPGATASPGGEGWTETYEGGSPQAERLRFEQYAHDIMGVQLKAKKAAKAFAVTRTFHAKAGAGVHDAELAFLKDLPAEYRVGFAKPGAAYPAIVRLSNAANSPEPDFKKDLRGIAVRVLAERPHDLLATSFPVSHARNAHQFVAFAQATAGGAISRVFGLLGLVFKFGPFEVARMVGNVSKARRVSKSYALETYWSRGAITWGQGRAVRYLFRPLDPAAGPGAAPSDPDGLAHDLAQRLAMGDVRFELCVQRFVDAQRTPIEDTAVEWLESVSQPVPVAVLTLPQRTSGLAEARVQAREIEQLSFNPWNTGEDFRPLGNLNRARRAAYDASAAHRLAYRWREDPPLRNVVFGGLSRGLFKAIDAVVPWWKLSLNASLLNLDAFRHELRKKNLIDTELYEAPPKPREAPAEISEDVRVARTFDGTFNDLSVPKMGAVGATFGRNMPAILRPDLYDEPNPVEVAQALLHRKSFIPATSLNILAAAWIQFQVHDWVNHARHPLGKDDVLVPMPGGQKWTSKVGGKAAAEMRIAGNIGMAETHPDAAPILFGDAASHWWDASEVYGADSAKARGLREGPKLRLDNGYLPDGVDGFAITGFNESWWLGLSSMHLLFAREHNHLCGELKSHYPHWGDDQVYNTARLIVAALIAKIHTVEWTPAILATETIKIALGSNWSGPPNDWATKFGLWLLDAHAKTGIPETKPDHTGAPYCLTEDFATVYRLHPLIPDDFCFLDHRSGVKLDEAGFLDIQGAKTDAVMRKKGLEDVLYSLGVAHPGAIALHNFPKSLTGFQRGDEIIDLSVVDIVRTRRRGVPRFNDFRAALHKPRITRWEDLTADPESVRILKDLYKDIDKVDTVVGLTGEPAPPGFGFSDTAFRIFILMASRRLQSDRFLTVDFRPEVYSPFGMDWIANNGMTSVILRHCPHLASVLPRDQSAFAPWRPIIPA